MLKLEITKRTDERLLERMKSHYSKPKGFVGRNICYAIYWNEEYLGHIIGGSATRFLPGRNEFLNSTLEDLNHIINNIFYNIRAPKEGYPKRNFTSYVVRTWQAEIAREWKRKYGDFVLGFETLVEKPRKGTLYKKAGWRVVGETKGYTCKRIGGEGSDSWSGKRVWDTENLKPKWVLCDRWREE